MIPLLRRKGIFVLIYFLFVSCGKVINDVETNFSPVTVDMESMRWGMEDFPLNIKVSENLNARSQALIGSSLDEWESAGNIDVFQVVETTPVLNFSKLSDYYYKDRLVHGIYLADNKVDELSTPTLAVTQIIFYTNRESADNPYYHIVHTDIVINGYDYSFSTNPFDNSSYYLLTLVLHEVGHVLGLGHQNQGIMYPSMSTQDKQESLNPFDINLISEKYDSIKPALKSAETIKSYVPAPGELKRVLLFLPAAPFLANKRLNIQRRVH
jgi:predicted Zn-dependent protease